MKHLSFILLFSAFSCGTSLDCSISLTDEEMNLVRELSQVILSDGEIGKNEIQKIEISGETLDLIRNTFIDTKDIKIFIDRSCNEVIYRLNETEWNMASEKEMQSIIYYSSGRQTSFTEEPWNELCRKKLAHDIHCYVEKIIN